MTFSSSQFLLIIYIQTGIIPYVKRLDWVGLDYVMLRCVSDAYDQMITDNDVISTAPYDFEKPYRWYRQVQGVKKQSFSTY
jgi:hypothetical protein